MYHLKSFLIHQYVPHTLINALNKWALVEEKLIKYGLSTFSHSDKAPDLSLVEERG